MCNIALLFLRAPRGKELESDSLEGSNQGPKMHLSKRDVLNKAFFPLRDPLAGILTLHHCCINGHH